MTADAAREPIEGRDGHTVGLIRRRGFAVYEDGDTATLTAWITFERSRTDPRRRGYAVYRFPDGAIKVGRFTGSGDPEGRQIGEFIFEVGTGRCQGIAGQGRFAGQRFPHHGEIVLDVSGDLCNREMLRVCVARWAPYEAVRRVEERCVM